MFVTIKQKLANLLLIIATKWSKWNKLQKFFAVCGIMSLLLWLRIQYKKLIGRIYKLPPEVYGLPTIGSLLEGLIYPEKFVHKTLAKYNDLVIVSYGTCRMCMLNNIDLISKVYQKAYQRNKLQDDMFSYFGFETPVVSCNNDKNWEIRRKTLMRNLTKLLNKLR